MRKILYAKPSITDLEIKYVNDAVKNGWGEHCYEYINKFQNNFKDYLGVKYSLATSSCTGALHISLAAIGLKEGDEVIVPDITWSASVVPVTYFKAKPIMVDILKNTWCIDPQKVEKAITKKTKAIIAVHLYGNLAEINILKKIAKKYNLFLIEDAAEALGSEINNKKAGSFGDIGIFSFHGTKTITTGEGGMIVTNKKKIYDKIKILADHGRQPRTKKMFWIDMAGFKYKMSNIQAALGYAQLKRIKKLIKNKRDNFKFYLDNFKDLKEINLNPEEEGTLNSYWMPTIIFNNFNLKKRDKLINFLQKNNIDTRPFFYPLSLFNMFQRKYENKVAYEIYKKGINLPNYHEMSKNDIVYIVDKIKRFLKNYEV